MDAPEIGLSKSGLRCSWCLAEFKVMPDVRESHGICQRHYDELKAQVLAKRMQMEAQRS